MKNKKLFAILTLVCFMFTLMPVAAFAVTTDTYNYVEVTGNTTVEAGQSVQLTMDTDFTTTSYYVFAYKDGVYYSQFGIKPVTFGPSAEAYTQSVTMSAVAGDYELYVVDANSQTNIVMNNATLLNSEKAAKMLADTTLVSMVDGKNKVTVVNPTVTYYVAVTPVGAAIQADNGYTTAQTKVVVKVGDATGKPVTNVPVNVYTDSYGLQVTKQREKTNVKGEIDLVVTGSVPGIFNVYAEFGGTTSVAVPVTVDPVGLSNVEVVAEPTAPINRTAPAATAANSGIEFKLTDKFGTTVSTTPSNHKVTLIEAPAGVDKNVALTLVDVPSDGKEALIKRLGGTDFNLPVNGTYTFKVALQNGVSATASVTVADFGKTASIKFDKAPVTMPYGAAPANVLGAAGKVFAVDEKGVTKDVTASVAFSANGSAISSFVDVTTGGFLAIKDKVDYVGSKVSVIAVYTENGKTFTATHEVTVVDDAALLKFVDATAEVGANSTLYAYVLDANGKNVSLPQPPTTAVQVIVLEKPANSVATISGATLNVKGQVEFDLLASAAGEYKLQTIVTYNGKYISSIDTITVGGGEGLFNDVIVMSIGANSLVKNSEVVAMPAAPEIVDSRTMVPARAGLEAFGAVVVWDEATRTVTAELNGVKVVMTIGDKVYTVNGVEKVGDAAPYITAASTMVPVSFFTNAFGITATPIYDDHGVCDVLFTK